MSTGIRLAVVLTGSLLVISAVALSSNWYFELPLPTNINRFPVAGVTLFKIALLLEGLLLLSMGAVGWQYRRIRVTNRLHYNVYSHGDSSPAFVRSILAITGLAILLRSLGLSQSLWIDEIVTLNYAASTLYEQLTVFISPNNHMLNSLLIKLSISLFGESEWSVRLPAAIFGVATIPLLYWVTRAPLGTWPAIAVSLLLAVSYHHIFFSQNARGYSAHLFLSLFATGLFLRGLRQDELRVWALYIVVMFLNSAALMNSLFVSLAHVTVGIIALSLLRRQGSSVWPIARRLFFVFLILGLLIFHLYAIEIPQIYVILNELYVGQATGFPLFSIDFLQELIRGVSAGFGTGAVIAAMPFVLAVMVGFISFLKKDFLLALLLLLPGVITALYLVAKGLTVSPRFFLFEIFIALISAVSGIIITTTWLGSKLRLNNKNAQRVSVAVVILLTGLSIISLNYYYRTPKQSYREAVEYIEQEKSEAAEVIVIFTASAGIAYYHAKTRSVDDAGEYTYLRDVDKFKAELQLAKNKSVYIVTTFHRALGISLPEILNELKEHWQIEKTFPATIGDGEISIWVKK